MAPVISAIFSRSSAGATFDAYRATTDQERADFLEQIAAQILALKLKEAGLDEQVPEAESVPAPVRAATPIPVCAPTADNDPAPEREQPHRNA